MFGQLAELRSACIWSGGLVHMPGGYLMDLRLTSAMSFIAQLFIARIGRPV
ncbi:hypothetical protein [Paenibacillus roseipurpureus]|uniref:Uncharacterized protein n=1 Tax=Paenibacillus roseopurpureus TaxID=2918901 RepID=A0AA96LPP7_9BACL|nr:hypothetical protein [Paenibacillus sp. MBLB1832]WNR44939.1 hypothetical protein MJB10_01950 [Paenibacillus sp. MBLB1832]